MVGRLILVVGPSGVGKDSLLDGARAALKGDPAFVFPRRYTTREPDLGGEDYIALTPDEFDFERARGTFALSWEAHGLSYGVPASIRGDLAMGINVVVNVSRAVLDAARATFPGLRVISIIAPRDILRQRLLARGRETEEEIEERLERAEAFQLDGPDVLTISNDATLEEGIARFVGLIRQAAQKESARPAETAHPSPAA